MSTPLPEPICVFGTDAVSNGIRLYGTVAGLLALADLLDGSDQSMVVFDQRQDDSLEDSRLSGMRVLEDVDRPITLRLVDRVVEISGGRQARHHLAVTLRNLAVVEPAGLGEIPRHVDLAYFQGHDWLAPDSAWATVTLLPDCA